MRGDRAARSVDGLAAAILRAVPHGHRLIDPERPELVRIEGAFTIPADTDALVLLSSGYGSAPTYGTQDHRAGPVEALHGAPYRCPCWPRWARHGEPCAARLGLGVALLLGDPSALR